MQTKTNSALSRPLVVMLLASLCCLLGEAQSRSSIWGIGILKSAEAIPRRRFSLADAAF